MGRQTNAAQLPLSGMEGDALLDALRLNTRLLAELEARYNVNIVPVRREGMATINCPEDVVNLVGPEMRGLAQEQLRVLLLDTRNRVTGTRVIYQGNVNSSVVRPAEVFKPAIVESATSIIVVHNHPSGEPTPSGADVSITRDLVAGGKLLGVEVLDHVVIGNPGYVSMKEQRLGFD